MTPRSINPDWLQTMTGTKVPVIAGPCSAESLEQVVNAAQALKGYGIHVFRAGAWKPRTLPGGFQGYGAVALDWIAEAKRLTGMPTTTEVATPEHVGLALDSGVDIVWVGARTVANPFAVQEVADALAMHPRGHEVGVFVKNPVSPDLELWIGALERLNRAGIRRIAAVHRGFTAPVRTRYRNEPMWHLPIELAVRFPFLPILADPSHMGGDRSLVESISRQALDLGFHGLMIESHCNPDLALSDAAQQVTPAQLADILSRLERPSATTGRDENLELMRAQLDALDSELIGVLARRMDVARQIGAYKQSAGMPVLQTGRFSNVMDSRAAMASDFGLSPEFLRRLMLAIHEESVRQQLSLRHGPIP